MLQIQIVKPDSLIEGDQHRLLSTERKMRLTSFVLCLLMVGTLPASADTQAPSVVNGVSATAISNTAVRITWNKPWDDQSIAGYNVYRNGTYFATVFDTYFVDNNVQPKNNYSYGIVAFDNAKNFNTLSNEVSVSTGGDAGTVAPPPPEPDNGTVNAVDGLFSEIQNGNAATIKWRAPSGNVKGYNVYRNNGYLTTVTAPEFSDSNLNWGEDYRYQIVTFNDANQFSQKSATLTVNTASGQSNNDGQQDGNTIQNDPVDNSSTVPAGYSLVFSDEFNGYSLDPSKWNSSYRWGPGWAINGEKQYYVDRINNPDFGHSPFEFDGNAMTISAIRTPDHLAASAHWQPYLSGALTTFNKFKMRYGYVEIRAQLPKGRGLWSAFWMLHQHDHDQRPEIDVLEYIGDQPNTVFNTYHYYENWNLRSTPSYEAPGPDYSADFHTYGMKWEAGKITWYVDGVERNTHINGNVAWEEMYLLVNLAVGGWWPGDPDGSTVFPAQYKIDYIRAYQQ